MTAVQAFRNDRRELKRILAQVRGTPRDSLSLVESNPTPCDRFLFLDRAMTYCSTIGCSPQFALNGEVSYLPADERLGIREALHLEERKHSVEEENRLRTRQKKNFDRRHSSKLPAVSPGDDVLVRKGSSKQFHQFLGPFKVTNVQIIQGVAKRIEYEDGGVRRVAALQNIV